MALYTKDTKSTLLYSILGSPINKASNSPIVRGNTPNKVKGLWITFPNGTKFRRSTSYSRWETHRELGDIQDEGPGIRNFLGVRRSVYAKSSPGGYLGGDSMLSSASFNDPHRSGAQHYNSPSIPTQRKNEVYTKALLKIASQKANVGETLGTMRQTLKLIHSPAKSLISGLTSVYRDRALRPYIYKSIRDVARQPLTRASERYLEYVYGWKPLVSDIHGAMELLKEKGDSPLFLSAHANSRVKVELPVSGYINASEGLETFTGPTISRSLVRTTLYARVDPNASGLRALNQLGLANPLATAWELVGWSFVIDWFVPIGPVLNALSAPAGLIFVNGSVSNRVSQRAPYTSRYNGVQQWTGQRSSATGTVFHEGYTRQELTSWPFPGLWIDPDPFRGDRPLKALALAIINLRAFR